MRIILLILCFLLLGCNSESLPHTHNPLVTIEPFDGVWEVVKDTVTDKYYAIDGTSKVELVDYEEVKKLKEDDPDHAITNEIEIIKIDDKYYEEKKLEEPSGFDVEEITEDEETNSNISDFIPDFAE